MKKGSTFTKEDKDITGKKYGLVTVVKYSHTHKRRSHWICKCECGKILTISRKTLVDKSKNLNCGCLPRQGKGNKTRTWEESVGFLKNSIMNLSHWEGECLISDAYVLKNNGYPRCSFLNISFAVKDVIWFVNKLKKIESKHKVILKCGNPRCINIKHMEIVYDNKGQRNPAINQLFEIYQRRRKSETE